MKQKLVFSCALIHKKSFILDEPTTGVDPVSEERIWRCDETSENNKESPSVDNILYMDEATLCDRVVLMQNGKF